TEYDKDHVEELGLLKMDFLGLRTLTVISDTIANIEKSRHEKVDIEKIPLTDELTSKMLCEGKTGAVFQMESAGMTQLVRDLAPENFADLIPLVALYRPGPLGSGMVEDFIKGRHGEKEVTYMHPLLEPILKETFGVVLYQEQVMQIVQVLAGFTLGQADLLRRAMGKKKHEILMAQKENFLVGCEKNHIEAGLANTIFDLLTHFADYGFNKSHSAAYALVAWQTAYLKAHYPAEFMAAMLTSIMDTPKVATYIELCRRMGIKILPPDINASSAYFSVDGAAIRFGLAAVRNVGETAIENVARIREDGGPFSSLSDFCRRVDMRVVNRRVIESLIKCGAFDSFGAKRSQLLAILPQTVMEAAQQQKDAVSGQMGLFSDETIEETGMLQLPDIDEVPKAELLNWEKEATGFYITGHPLDQYAAKLENLPHIGSLQPDAVRDKQVVRIGGILTEAKRITTKKGDTMCFATVEDFTDSVEVTVFPRTFYQNMNLLVPDTPVVVQGRIDMTDESVKIIADSVWALKDYRFAYYIELPTGGLPETKREEMKQLIAAHHGAYATFFHSGGHWQKARENFWLDDAAETFQRLESIVGAGKVRKR
ncbi:DNA polymerase III subunit alpha, partial [Mitsuokella jalaludinii]